MCINVSWTGAYICNHKSLFFWSIPIHSNNKLQLFGGLQINYLSTTSSINYRIYAMNTLGVIIQV